MPRPLRDQIRDHLRSYLARNESATALERWLIGATYNIHKHPDEEARRLSGQAELVLAEFDRGHRDGSSVRQELSRLLAESSALIAP